MILPVKKLLLILLLGILPLQLSWAAAAVYCQHEKEQSSRHYGHHEHQHESAGVKSAADKPASIDNDCGTCHVSAQPSFLPAITLALPPLQRPYAHRIPAAYTSHIPDGPLRPDWRRPA